MSIEDLIARTGIRRDELATLAEIGALNAFGHDRRSALWQVERAVRPAGALFEEGSRQAQAQQVTEASPSPLVPMTPVERVIADYAGTGLTLGPHPIALRRSELAMRGVLRPSTCRVRATAGACGWPAPSLPASGPGRPRGSSS